MLGGNSGDGDDSVVVMVISNVGGNIGGCIGVVMIILRRVSVSM